MQSFAWRYEEGNIANSIFFEKNNNQLCTFQRKAIVYLPHMPLRLSEIKDIPHPYQLTLAIDMLSGFQKLYQHVGFFKVDENQVCLDQEGEVRVWINSDLSKNFAEPHFENQETEDKMVGDILRLIFANVDSDSQPEPLDKFLNSHLYSEDQEYILSLIHI